MDLARRRCQACVPGTPTLDRPAAERLRAELDARWSLEPGRLKTRFTMRSFRDAFAFATAVALLSEQEGHHPDLGVGWGYVDISLTTHAAGGLTENDFIMAAKVDRISAAHVAKDEIQTHGGT